MINSDMKKYLYSSALPLVVLGGFYMDAAFAQGLTNPIAGGTDLHVVIGMILKGVLGLTGTVALIMFVYGGFQWLLARGEPGEVKKGMDTMIWAALGLAVIFGSYAILDRIFTIIPQ